MTNRACPLVFPTGPVTGAIVVVALAWAQAGCDNSRPRRSLSSSNGCSGGLRRDPARSQRLQQLLSSTEPGARLLAEAGTSLDICFGPVPEPAITEHHQILLDSRTGDGESAARLGHLLLHLVEGPPMSDTQGSSQPCKELVGRAILAEARAHALELELRRTLGVTRPSREFAFTKQFWATPGQHRIELLRSYFMAHPDGDQGVPSLANAYEKRCVELRR